VGRLVFKGATLREILQEVDRYHNVSIQWLDPKLQDLDVSGNFKSRDLDRLLASIEATLPVRVRRLGGGGVLVIGPQ
jgi:transmembrane sensor